MSNIRQGVLWHDYLGMCKVTSPDVPPFTASDQALVSTLEIVEIDLRLRDMGVSEIHVQPDVMCILIVSFQIRSELVSNRHFALACCSVPRALVAYT